MQIVKARTEEGTGLLEGTHAPLDKELRKNGIHSKFRRKLPYIVSVNAFAQFPYLFYRHIQQRYGFFC